MGRIAVYSLTAAVKLVKGAEDLVVFTSVVYVIIIHNRIAVGIGGMAVSGIGVSGVAYTFLYSYIGPVGACELTISVVCPVTVG